MHTSFQTTTIKSSLYCCTKVFILYPSLPEKEDFYSLLNMEDITDADNAHARIVCKDFEIVNFGEYHDWPVQIDTLLLADVFKIFRNMCFKI